MISPRAFFKSIRHALRGLVEIFNTEQSFRLQVLATVIVLGLLLVLDLAAWQRILLLLLCAAVMILEILNSIIERVADAVQPRLSPMVKDVKDMMAGAVLLTAFTALVIGAVILYQPVWEIVCVIIHYCKT